MTEATILDTPQPGEATFGEYFALLKPRVMRLVIFTALVGLVCAPAAVHPVVAFAALLCVAVGAGASGALNMWWDADIDRLMKRTRSRPIPAGRVAADEARAIGLALSGMAVMMLALFANLFSAALLAFTIFFYVVIYSMWLKRATPQNIVIGGAAGAFPPMIGWAIATGGVSFESVLMFGLIFVWTPPHFWALALFRRDDYAVAEVPMLPVTHGPVHTRRSILVYSLVLAPVSLAPAFTSIGGPLYLAVSLALNAVFLSGAVRLVNRDERQAAADGFSAEKRFFGFSIAYLFLHFLAFLAEAGLRSAGMAMADWPASLGILS
ncbi:MAG: heme o synthase [Paracoccaceae bacterium]